MPGSSITTIAAHPSFARKSYRRYQINLYSCEYVRARLDLLHSRGVAFICMSTTPPLRAPPYRYERIESERASHRV